MNNLELNHNTPSFFHTTACRYDGTLVQLLGWAHYLSKRPELFLDTMFRVDSLLNHRKASDPAFCPGLGQPPLEAPVAHLADYTCSLIISSSLTEQERQGLFGQGGLLGPSSNPPNFATYAILRKILPCNPACAHKSLIHVEELAQADTELLLNHNGIVRLAPVHKLALQEILASERACEKLQVTLNNHITTIKLL